MESGGVIYLPTGNLYIGNLQLDAGSKVYFSNPLYETSIYIKKTSIWRGEFMTYPQIGLKEISTSFRLFYYGNDRLFIDSNWAGTIIAPNAEIILGQTSAKMIFGQFYANKIHVHQKTYITNIPFEPYREGKEYVFKKRHLNTKGS